MGRNSGLDLLRFLSAMAVMLYHYLFFGASDGRIAIFRFGHHGVDVFFVISGFVISLSVADKTPMQFALARVVRLVPAFYVCCFGTLIFLTLSGQFAPSEFMPTLLANLTFMPRELGFKAADDVYWTLSFEIRFYFVVFMLLVTGLWRRWSIHVWLAIALLNEFWWRLDFLSNAGITYFIGFFGLGVLLAQMMRGSASWLDVAFLLVATALTWSRGIDTNEWIAAQYGVRDPHLLAALYAPVALLIVFAFLNLPIPKTAWKTTANLGAISYPLYLLHITAANIIAMTALPAKALFAAVLAIGLSAVVALLIEPWLRSILRAGLEQMINRQAIVSGT